MKKNMDKTTKNNLINYGIVIALFVIVQILSGTGHLSRLITGLHAAPQVCGAWRHVSV